MPLKKSDKIFVAGHRGLVGSALVESLRKRGYQNLVLKNRAELDLLNTGAVNEFYANERPNAVFVAAAKVGGIHANNAFRADFIYENLQIQNNVIWGAHRHDVETLAFLGSSCIYPRLAPQPMPEICLLTGELEFTNRPYALAKISGLELVNSLRAQYGRQSYFSVMPTNLYGPRDNFHPENSHVLPALIRRFVEAKETNQPSVVVWGTGSPRREFMHAGDCADATVFLTERVGSLALEESPQGKKGFFHVNVGVGEDVSIAELATLIAEKSGYRGRIEFDSTRPDGTPRKLLDVSFLQSKGRKQARSLASGVGETVDWYLQNRNGK